MKILSTRSGFLADHSSTSYEFLAVDKPLKATARTAVRRLSSRVRPTARKASFLYNGEWSDLPGGWEPLMAKYYDVMYTESYDWWTLAIAFDTTKKDLVAKLRQYEFRGVEDLGVDVNYKHKRLVLAVHCRLDPGHLYSYTPHGDDMWFNEEYDDDEDDGFEVDDRLLDLLVRIRDRLKKGDCQALYAVYDTYGQDEDDDNEYGPEDTPPRARKTKAGVTVAEEFGRLLARM